MSYGMMRQGNISERQRGGGKASERDRERASERERAREK